MMIKVAVGVLVLWVLALISGATLGGVLHLLPLVAVGLAVTWFVQRSKARAELDKSRARTRLDDQRALMRKALESRPAGRQGDED